VKPITFTIGLAWLLWGALTFGYPDWDVKLSLLMACSTYLCADWVWSALRHRRYVRWPLAALATWWCVDGSYWLYWSLVDPSVMIREGQWAMSLCLFLLCGAFWSIDAKALANAAVRCKQLIGRRWRGVLTDKAQTLREADK
jgi:hypothetical protein